MTKKSVHPKIKRQAQGRDLSFCYEAAFVPEGVEFSQLETPHKVVINLCPEHAGQILWHFGNAFTKLEKSARAVFDNCVLLFAKHLLANPAKRSDYQLDVELMSYLAYLEIDQVSCSQEQLSPVPGNEKFTRH